MASKTAYVPGIDGLRAIAVLGVVIYHLAPSVLPGGFAGVDVFFVISGYLITGIILREILEGRFSFREFYRRRAIRILPPLIAMLAAVLCISWLYLTPDEFKTLGRHALAGLLFVSNFQLLSESGYFDTASELKPLLHLWSLGIEEQFYILWPVLLIAVFKSKIPAKWRLPTLGLVTLSSLAFCLFTTPADPSKAFYHPASRIWEMGAGALLQIFLLQYRSSNTHGLDGQIDRIPLLAKRLIAPLGLLLILSSYFSLKTTSPFPGWRALLPVTGSLLVLLSFQVSAYRSQFRSQLLEHSTVVGIGKISYSLYLWHWPPIALGHILYGQDIPPSYLGLALGFAIATSLFSYFLVEKPVRFGQLVPRYGALKVIGLPSFAVLLLAGLMTAGVWPSRAQHDFLEEARSARDDWSFPGKLSEVEVSGGRLFLSKTSFDTLVVGDSNAEQYATRFLQLEKTGVHLGGIGFLTRSSCPPLPAVKRTRTTQCDGFFESLQTTLESYPQIRTVILAAQWAGYLWSDEYVRADGRPISESLNDLRAFFVQLNARGIRTRLILNIPVDERLAPERTFQRDLRGRIYLEAQQIEMTAVKNLAKTNSVLMGSLSDSEIRIANPTNYLCPSGMCQTLDQAKRPIYKDCCHLRASYVEQHAIWIDDLLSD